MKKVMVMTVAALAAVVSVQAADVSVSADFASAYVFRGVTLNNGLVFQPGAEISGFPIPEEYGSVAAGIWANYDLDDQDGMGSDFSEVDYYMSYTLPISILDISFGYCEYTYPNDTGDSNRELSASIGSALGTNGLYSSISAYYGIDGLIDEDLYIEGALDYEMALSDALSLSAGATVGYLITDGSDDDGFHNATASIGLGYALNENWSVSAGLTYIAQLDEAVLADMSAPGAYDGYDVDFVGTVGVACDF